MKATDSHSGRIAVVKYCEVVFDFKHQNTARSSHTIMKESLPKRSYWNNRKNWQIMNQSLCLLSRSEINSEAKLIFSKQQCYK